jgi:hypothetical protein
MVYRYRLHPYLYILRACFMIELFFRFNVKGPVVGNNLLVFSILCGPLYGPAVYAKIRQIRETGLTLRAPLFTKS